MIYELLPPVLQQLKVSIRTVSGAYSLRVRFNTRYLWTGLNWVSKNGPMSNSELAYGPRTDVSASAYI